MLNEIRLEPMLRKFLRTEHPVKQPRESHAGVGSISQASGKIVSINCIVFSVVNSSRFDYGTLSVDWLSWGRVSPS